jgi:hypothetical protein
MELPAFERHRESYLSDDDFRRLQIALLENPMAGSVMEGTGGLRKLRFADSRRGKGARGGLRVVFYYWIGGPEFWLVTLYDKDEAADLTPGQRDVLKTWIKAELKARRGP